MKGGSFLPLKHKKSLKIKDFCVRVQNCCPILAPPAGLELGFTSSLRLSYTNFASKILPCRASAQIVTLPQVQQEREKENRVRMDSVSFLGS